ncbi:unnamed protein product [Withania somnifera]
MGTPAFPNLGKHCSVVDCKQIDFLPFTCDCCYKIPPPALLLPFICPTTNKNNVTVVICSLCAKGVRLNPDEDPNITWESHVNTECDPSNYEKATKKKKCPVPRCKELLTFSNTIKCRDCTIDHCLKHRFGPDHTCPGPKKPETSFQFINFLNGSKEEPKKAQSTSSSRPRAYSRHEFNQTQQTGQSSRATRHSVTSNISQLEPCPQCHLRFSTARALIDHVQKVHEKNGVMNWTVDVCPRCSNGFRDPVALVEHVEREHKGTSKA